MTTKNATRQLTPDVTSATGSPRSPQPKGSAHTPGPWRVFTESFPEGPLLVDVVTAESVTTICEFNGENATDLANANLIAAAPELLEALKAITDDYEGDAFDGRLSRALAAINKAEGR